MNKQLTRMLLPQLWVYFAVMGACVAAALLLGQYWLALGEGIALLALLGLYLLRLRHRRRAILEFVENAAADLHKTVEDVRSMPLPMA